MITVAVAVFMWALVLILALRARSRPDNSMLRAAGLIAASLTTNIDQVYLWVNAQLPWANALDLVANLLLITGIYYLSSAITRGAIRVAALRERGTIWMRGAAQATAVLMVVSFALIDDPVASTTFMRDYGNQIAAAAYSAVQYVYIFSVMSGTLITCLQNVPKMRRPRFRVGFSIIGAGCFSALALCSTVIAMDVANVVGAAGFLSVAGPIYDVLYLITVLLLCIGLAIPPVGRLLTSISLRRKLARIEPDIRSVWLTTVAKSPTVSLVGTTFQDVQHEGWSGRRSLETVHRLVIEIHDWLNVESSSDLELTPAQREALERAETLCLRQGRAIK
ncbi:hypothetical protein PTW37_17010 (plasmid) [Arthrobacter agilis]|uniref:hypothetical protein n=1 Tax=Arthrobacter agilis TaxID=37921 RepID=UPI0023661E87|nr:hypothetical protein [Arthrobacter agilis]WDF35049.1 hypothetical protein PTW37_17010 [Arthrobacter agilis]